MHTTVCSPFMQHHFAYAYGAPLSLSIPVLITMRHVVQSRSSAHSHTCAYAVCAACGLELGAPHSITRGRVVYVCVVYIAQHSAHELSILNDIICAHTAFEHSTLNARRRRRRRRSSITHEKRRHRNHHHNHHHTTTTTASQHGGDFTCARAPNVWASLKKFTNA